MATVASLMEHYYDAMYPNLKALEEKRLSVLSTLKKSALILFVLASLVMVVLMQSAVPTFYATAGAFGGAVALFLGIYRYQLSGYEALFKENIIEQIIHFIDPSFTYEAGGKMSEYSYQKSNLFSQEYDRFRGSDYVRGQKEGVSFEFSHLHVEKKEKTKNNHEEYHTLFQGIFFCATFNKAFKGKTYLFPDIAEHSLGSLGQWFQSLRSTHGELIRLDHPEFESLFVVYGSDQIEARYLLTPAMMERIVAFYKRYSKRVSMGFIEGHLFIALEQNRALFEANLRQSVLHFETIQRYFESLQMIFGMIETLKLNQQLWSKPYE